MCKSPLLFNYKFFFLSISKLSSLFNSRWGTFSLCLFICLCCSILKPHFSLFICAPSSFNSNPPPPPLFLCKASILSISFKSPPICLFLFLLNHASLSKFITSNIDKISPPLFFRSIIIIIHGHCCHHHGLHTPFHPSPFSTLNPPPFPPPPFPMHCLVFVVILTFEPFVLVTFVAWPFYISSSPSFYVF